MTAKDESTYRSELTQRFPGLLDLVGRRYTVKFGGAAMESPKVCEAVCRELAAHHALGIQVVVVHGGGKEISRLLERLAVPSEFVGGLRVTSREAMAVTEMVLSGSINKRLVALLSQHGASAVGVSGRDGQLLVASVLRGAHGEDLGQTGEVSECNPKSINVLLAARFLPVVSPVGESVHGGALNLNADYAAAAISGALHSEKAIFLTDVDGVRAGGEILNELATSQIQELIKSQEITGGMIPKVTCALRAVESGAREAVICNASKAECISQALLSVPGAGTRITL
jgi:acetylglutamate kinase